MKIVADENIPLLEHYFSQCGELVALPGRSITPADVIDADMLLVRSVTQVNQQLLQHSRVKFVGSTTSGYDHLDTEWLDKAGIQWRIAKGCNAEAVAEYVVCVIAVLQQQGLLNQPRPRAGVIGVGEVGQRVVRKLQLLGFETVLCDPFRMDVPTVPIDQLMGLDLISLHVPLTREGEHATYHLIDRAFMQRQQKNTVIVNASRGEVVSFQDLKQEGQSLVWCLDVWEDEPQIDPDVLSQVRIATPHIAGYSVESKYRGIEMIYQAALGAGVITGVPVESCVYPLHEIRLSGRERDWRDVVLTVFDPLQLTQQMREALQENPAAFDGLRKGFAHRHEFEFVRWGVKDLA